MITGAGDDSVQFLILIRDIYQLNRELQKTVAPYFFQFTQIFDSGAGDDPVCRVGRG